jgi:hypothetical protein
MLEEIKRKQALVEEENRLKREEKERQRKLKVE